MRNYEMEGEPMRSVFTYHTLLGDLTLAEGNGSIENIYFQSTQRQAKEEEKVQETSLLRETYRQLTAYFSGDIQEFDLPINPMGTPFQKAVWRTLMEIPYGKTASYQEVAQIVGKPKASRAVGMANNRNPIPIIIPCHRVIGANGKLVGYGGGIGCKEYLLRLENPHWTSPMGR